MTGKYRPVDPAQLPDLLAEHLHRTVHNGGALRVAVDGPSCAHPYYLAEAVRVGLRMRGRVAEIIDAHSFWRDASLRLEFGREDADTFALWLDATAMRREVLDPLGPDGHRAYLPSLRDPESNRVTRAPARCVPSGAIVIICGELLLAHGLLFDVTIHLGVSAAARARRTEPEWQWTLPAFARYDADVRPADTADIVIRIDDPQHPAMRKRGEPNGPS